MRFALDPEIVDFASSIDSLLAKSDMPAVIRSWNDADTAPGLAVWAKVAETGAAALLIPEEMGGAGASAIEAIVALEVLGKHAVPGPVVESIMVAPRLLSQLGAEVAEELASGALATVAAPPASPYAADAHVAQFAWVAADNAVFTALSESGQPCAGECDRPQQSVDRARTVCKPSRGEQVSWACSIDVMNHGALGTAAQLLGLGRAMLDMSVEYAKQRKQYGKFIGEYQALKHQLADVAIALEMARPLLWAGALAIVENPPFDAEGTLDPDSGRKAARDVSAAKIACADAADLAARTALQVHGAIGYTLEHDLGLWLTKARALQSAWGTQSFHRGRVLEAITEGARP